MDDKRTQREHLESVAAVSAVARAQLAAHPCPPVMRRHLSDFRRVSRWRGAGGMGPAPITLHDIEVYERRLRGGKPFTPGELDLFRRLDDAVLTPAGA
jgi:hypothetical protein